MNAVPTTPVSTDRNKNIKTDISKTSESRAMNAVIPKRKIGIGPTPCFVCGSDKHSWLDCPKRKKGRCGCCGSEAHLTRMCAQRYHPAVRMSFNQCMFESEQVLEYIEENEPIEDSDVEMEDSNQEAVEECTNQLQLHENALDSSEQDELNQELDQIKISFNALSLCCDSSLVDALDVEIPPNVIDQYTSGVSHSPLPWQIPSPRDYELYELEEDMPIKLYSVARHSSDSEIPESEEELELPLPEATILSSRMPRRKYKLKFHTDAKQKPHAPINPKWESQLTLVEANRKTEAAKKELQQIRQSTSSQTSDSSFPLNRNRPQYEQDRIASCNGDMR